MLKLPLFKALYLEKLTFRLSVLRYEIVSAPCFLLWARVALHLKSFGSIHALVIIKAIDIILLLLFICGGLQPRRVYLCWVTHYFRHRRIWNTRLVALCVSVSSWERLCLAVDREVCRRPCLDRLTWVGHSLHLLPQHLLRGDVFNHLPLVLVHLLSRNILVCLTLHRLHLYVGHYGWITTILPGSGRIWHHSGTVESVAGLQAHLLRRHRASHWLVDGLRGRSGHCARIGSCLTHLRACWGSSHYLLLLNASTSIPLFKERSLTLVRNLLRRLRRVVRPLYLSVCLCH